MSNATKNGTTGNHLSGLKPLTKRFVMDAVDDPGEFRMIHKDDLHVDPQYQRRTRETKARTFAKKWSWIACGTLTVSDRNGRIFVIDGGHRLMAARLRSDITELPCRVFKSASMADEADGFLDANGTPRTVSPYVRLKAQILTGDTQAVEVLDLVREVGLSFGDKDTYGSILCVKAFRHAYGLDPATMRDILPLVAGITRPGKTIDERVITGLHYLEMSLRKQGSQHSILSAPWKKTIVALGHDGIKLAAAKAAGYYARGGSKIYAIGIQDALNKGCTNRLSINGVDD